MCCRFVLDFSAERLIEVEVSQTQWTGEAGLLPIRQFDEAIRLTVRFAAALGDARGGEVLHSNLSMVRQRISEPVQKQCRLSFRERTPFSQTERRQTAESFLDRFDGILADDEDQNDHDTLRSDPAFKRVRDRLPKGIDLASQPTLSRFEPPRAGGVTPS